MALPVQIGRYRVTGLLGRGAMGVVYQGVDDSLDRAVAVKVMSASAVADADAWARFKREAQAVARLQHPNIVVIYELGEQEGLPFMALELLDGLDLQRAIESGLRPDPKVAIPVVLQVLAGLAHAHEHGIVHRDLKPSNVFLPYRRAAKIMDFGLARLGQGASTTGVVGTPHYMSPEQARGAHLDARSDLFSAGLILYEAVTGEKAYVGDSLPSILYKIVHEEPDIATLPSSGAWKGLRTVLQRALARDPESRYPDAASMGSDLGHVLSDFGGPANWGAAAALTAPRRASAVEAPSGAGHPSPREPGEPAPELAPSEDPAPEPARTLSEMRVPVSWLLAGGGLLALAALVGVVLWNGGGSQRAPAAAGESPSPTTSTTSTTLPPPPSPRATVPTTPRPTPRAAPRATPPAAAPPAPPTTVEVAGSLDRANTALENRHYPRALAEARAVLRRDPGNSEARIIAEEAEAALVIEDCLVQARAELKKGDKTAAQDVLRRGLAINANEARLMALWREATE
jgi:eukaryotic-like serine/threonine-protein kinase